jgi:hypothetical protein
MITVNNSIVVIQRFSSDEMTIGKSFLLSYLESHKLPLFRPGKHLSNNEEIYYADERKILLKYVTLFPVAPPFCGNQTHRRLF